MCYGVIDVNNSNKDTTQWPPISRVNKNKNKSSSNMNATVIKTTTLIKKGFSQGFGTLLNKDGSIITKHCSDEKGLSLLNKGSVIQINPN